MTHLSVSPLIDLLEVFYPFVTMADSEDVIACYDQVGIHQAGQSSYNDMPDIRCDQAEALPVEVTQHGAVFAASACTVLV